MTLLQRFRSRRAARAAYVEAALRVIGGDTGPARYDRNVAEIAMRGTDATGATEATVQALERLETAAYNVQRYREGYWRLQLAAGDVWRAIGLAVLAVRFWWRGIR